MRSILPGVFILSLVIFFSCQKELSEAKPNQPGNNLLSKITTFSAGFTYIDSFAFDSQDRCIRLYKTAIDSFTNGNLTVYKDFCDFHYIGDEFSPYKITGKPQGRDVIWWILYDNLGRKILDSITYPGSNDIGIAQYNYSSNLIIAQSRGVYGGDSYHSTDSFDFDGNNCTKWRAFVFDGLSEVSWHMRMAHDNRANPISELNIAKSVLFGANGTLGDYRGLNKNNYTSSVVNLSNSWIPWTDIVTNLEYQYDSIGRPVLSMSHSVLNPSYFWTLKYEYN